MANEACETPNASDLPIELKILILEHLSDDEIRPLALVWRDMLPVIRARRFRNLTVCPQTRLSPRVEETPVDSDSDGHESDSFVAKAGSTKRTLPPSRLSAQPPISARDLAAAEAESQCEALRRLTEVLNEAPEVAEYIQSLTIWDSHPDPTTLKSALSRSPSLPAFVATIPQMPNLSHLCLQDLDFYLFHDPKVVHRALRQCHITSLEVKSCTLNMSIFLAILYAVVNLDVLRLEGLHLNPGFGDDSRYAGHITDFDDVEAWKNSKSAFLCVDELHMMLSTDDDWLFFDLLLSKNHSPLYDLRSFYMPYDRSLLHVVIDPTLYAERVSRFIGRTEECLEELHLGVLEFDGADSPPLQYIGGVHTLELGMLLTEWAPHDTSLFWCTQTLANIAQTSCLSSLTLTFECMQHWHGFARPPTANQCWEDLDSALFQLELEELSFVFHLTHRIGWDNDAIQQQVAVDKHHDPKMQLMSKMQTWFLESCLPESRKRYFGCDDPSENIGTCIFEWTSVLVPYSAVRAPSH
ncbi:hypothetical protein BDZ89DRAFT_1059461 [Hymenopellis radicata]|nr:hypothetical protein BDZ89DRAFT_1059461 [Hymenopellis radicata]